MGSSPNLKSAHMDWTDQSKSRNFLDQTSDRKYLDEEVNWREKNLAEVLNTHFKILRVTSFSKRWWNKEVAEAKKTWAKAKRKWGITTPDIVQFKQARNLFYRVIRKAK